MRIAVAFPKVLRALSSSMSGAIALAAAAGMLATARAEPVAPVAIDGLIHAPFVQYDRLLHALERYKTIAAHGGWDYLPVGSVLERGMTGPRVAALKRRMEIEGDLPPASGSGDEFDGALADAVRSFQERHGLDGDSRAGARTLAALNVPVERRVAQIAANLERWQRVPRELPRNRLEINVAAAELSILEANEPVLRMRVVVGSRRFPTPMLESRILAVVFNPPWNVPARIARNEILPRLRRQPGYLRENDIRIVGRPDDPYGETIDWRNLRSLPSVLLQQQPGPKNALGRIKFDIPNEDSVYLHDTPAKSAFKLSDRALSHGCVRLQYPEDVARYVLQAETRKDPDLIDRILAGSETVSVKVSSPLPVVFMYWTAFVADNGQVHFRNDIYGHDARLGEQPYLTSGYRAPEISPPGNCSVG